MMLRFVVYQKYSKNISKRAQQTSLLLAERTALYAAIKQAKLSNYLRCRQLWQAIKQRWKCSYSPHSLIANTSIEAICELSPPWSALPQEITRPSALIAENACLELHMVTTSP